MGAEPILHAVTVEPGVTRCGEEVRIVFRTRNYGSLPSPAGTVSFVTGAGLEPLDASEVAIAAVAPGEEVVASHRARVAAALPDRTEIVVGATLLADGMRYRTNVETLLVRSTAILDGPASGTFVEALGDEVVRVRAVVLNEGDGPAQHLRIALPAPLGCAPLEPGAAPGLREVRRLDPGEQCELALDVRIVEPVRELVADEALATHGEAHVRLPVRSMLRIAPALAIGDAFVETARRTGRMTVVIENRGWAESDAVSFQVALPNGVRVIVEDVTRDGIPLATTARRRRGENAIGRIARDRDGVRIELGALTARGTARVDLPVAFGAAPADGVAVVRLGDERVERPFAPQRVRDVRAVPLGGVQRTASGDVVSLGIRVINAGDVDERLTLRIAGEPDSAHARAVTVSAGAVSDLALPVRVPDVCGGSFEPAVVVEGEGGERARASFRFVLRGQIEPSVEQPARTADTSSVVAVLRCAERAVAGVPFAVRLVLDVAHEVRQLCIRVPAVAGTVYVAGSAELDGHALLDAHDAAASPFAGGGLVLHDVPAGTRIAAAWSLLAEHLPEDTEVGVEASVAADGSEPTLYAERIVVFPRDPFAVQPAQLPYHVEGYAIARDAGIAPQPRIDAPAEAQTHAPAEPAHEAITAQPAGFGGRHMDDLARLGAALRGRGLVAHLFALPLFFADEGSCTNVDLAALGAALRDVYDRLYVKLRIPHFVVSSEDLEDAESRRALSAWLERAQSCASPDRPALDPGRLAWAPYGAPDVLRALVALLPARFEDDAWTSALSTFAVRLDGVLARYEGAPLELFDDALSNLADRALDEARDDLLVILARYVAPLEAVC